MRAAVAEIASRLAPMIAPRAVCSVAGESGVGKTTLCRALCEVWAERGVAARILHQDDYFHLPPSDNHARRVADPSWVGKGEVDLARLEADVAAFRRDGQGVLLVEGTYVTTLAGIDLRVFIAGDHRQTEAARRRRARDRIDDHTDRILAIEHALIRQDRARADVVLAQLSPRT